MSSNALAAILALMHTADAARSHIESKLAAENLSHPKLAALQALHEAGESLPLTQLAGRLSCVKSNVTQLVDRLEADGFVQRRDDPNDRRSRLAVMTPAGREAFERGALIQDQAVDELFGALDEADAEHLKTLMAKVAERAK
jgi:DNA-binding MarR family transcriptional regulator